ncbi:pirin family protein [Proteus mirabilis]|uniref:pirin family protein n=1 Tax=Proteus mirabilis TaxID=584 RepID=UPI003190CC5F
MTVIIAPLQRANIGAHFRASGLRGQAALIDPFINVDHAWMSAPTFPPHPHAGFSAISYVFLDSETGIENRDSLGTHNLIRPGGLHWVTTGSGIIHQEDPAEEDKTVHSLQIFVRLPSGQEDIAPYPLSLEPEDVPILHLPGARVRVPLGRFADARSPLEPPTDVTILDISLEAASELTVPIAAGQTSFVMPILGPISIGEQLFSPEDLKLPVFRPHDDAQDVILRTHDTPAKVIIFAGKPFDA